MKNNDAAGSCDCCGDPAETQCRYCNSSLCRNCRDKDRDGNAVCEECSEHYRL